jgi:F0F1-type ATP synthase assembly protein I
MDPDKRKRSLENYARYSSIAFQMLAIILILVFAGYKLDGWLHTKPVLTVVFSFGSVIIAIYSVTRDLLKKKK